MRTIYFLFRETYKVYYEYIIGGINYVIYHTIFMSCTWI